MVSAVSSQAPLEVPSTLFLVVSFLNAFAITEGDHRSVFKSTVIGSTLFG